ncbi:hypothetical protein ABN034_32755 [Actinopolymorpha sp. B11F2]|uniref:hypothetical protein n=1 Tax=Actinopolymorpha sp. B11F2 TaxID=3160862 RepID=UPI0032E3C6FD
MADITLAPEDRSPASVELLDMGDADWARRTLLVITAEPRAASASLMLPFTRARVLRDGDLHDAEALAGTCFDTVVIDGPALGPVRRDLAAAWASEHVRPDGRVVILLEPAAGGSDATGVLTGLAWLGVATLDGHPCAVLRPAGGAGRPNAAETRADIAGRLTAAAQTLLAMPQAGRAGRPASSALHRAKRDREDSEKALLHHLRTLAKELADERRLRIAAEERHRDLERRHRTLETRYARLRDSKLGSATVRYWQLRKNLRRRLDG